MTGLVILSLAIVPQHIEAQAGALALVAVGAPGLKRPLLTTAGAGDDAAAAGRATGIITRSPGPVKKRKNLVPTSTPPTTRPPRATIVARDRRPFRA